MTTPWIGFDLDGTLVEYTEWKGPGHIGRPIAPMVQLALEHMVNGYQVKIFTARVWHPVVEPYADPKCEAALRRTDALVARQAIKDWCLTVFGRELEITCTKDYGMIALYDDRAIQVQKNTGLILGNPRAVFSTSTDP